MSNLDDRITAWRDDTNVEPSPALLERLKASVPSAPAQAPMTPLKVVVAVVVVVIAFAVLWKSTRVDFSPATLAPAVVSAPDASVPVVKACPARPRAVPVMAVPLMPRPWRDLAQVKAAEKQLQTRPLTCEAQLDPIRTILRQDLNTAEEIARLQARKAFLCGYDPNEPQVVGDCDDSDWCHPTTCEARDRSCLERAASGPPRSCSVLLAKDSLARIDCAATLRGEAVDAGVAVPEWCSSEAAKKEVAALRAKGAVPGSFAP